MSYTINPNAKNKWVRNAENTMDLSIETDASSVYLDNGRTLEQELGEGSMVSNVATVDTSTSKVIDGTLDGAYESCVFKGKSLVNLMTSCKDETLIEYRNPPADSNVANVSMIKPNTVYTIIYSAKYQEEGNTGHLIVRTQQDGGDINVSNGLTFGTTYKRFTYKFTTPSTIDYFVLRSNGHYFYVKEVMLLEGDYTNIDLPYFTGLCDVKMPALCNLNYCPFPKDDLKDGLVCWLDGSDGAKGDNMWIDRTGNGNNATLVNFNHNDLNGWTGEYLKFDGVNAYCTLSPFVADSFTINMVVNITRGYGSSSSLWYRQGGLFDAEANGMVDDFGLVVSEQGQIAAGIGNPDTTIRTTQTYLNKKVLISFVRDKEQGSYRLYINGELQAEGSCNNISLGSPRQFVLGAVATDLRLKPVFDCYSIMVYNRVLTPKEINMSTEYLLPSYVHKTNILHTSEEIVLREVGGVKDTYNALTGEYVQRIGERVYEQGDELNSLVKTDMINTQYELAEPITTIVEPSTIPFAYENGHVILESGFKGQSLLPTLEYSTVVNRAGQVESVAKVIQKQEKQLTMLEQMLIQNIINLDYNNTLLTLKNEMEEML